MHHVSLKTHLSVVYVYVCVYVCVLFSFGKSGVALIVDVLVRCLLEAVGVEEDEEDDDKEECMNCKWGCEYLETPENNSKSCGTMPVT